MKMENLTHHLSAGTCALKRGVKTCNQCISYSNLVTYESQTRKLPNYVIYSVIHY